MEEINIKKLHLGGELLGGGAQKVFRMTYELFKKEQDYVGGITEEKIDINFKNAQKEKYLLKIINTLFSFNNYIKLKSFLSKVPVDLVHLHSFNATLSPSILLALKGKIVVQTLHEYQIICPNSSLFSYRKNKICETCIGRKNKYKILILNCASKGLFYSLGKYICYLIFDKVFNQKKMISHFIVPSEFAKLKMIEDGIEDSKITVIENPIEKTFKVDDYSKKKDVIVYFGRFSKEKNVEILIETFKEILNIREGVKLFLIGKGKELENYKSLVSELNLNEHVIIKEFLSPEELKNILEKAKISILPSKWYETFGLTIIESIYARVYPITTDIGAMKENVENNVGKTFKTKKEMMNLIIEILENYENYQKEIDENYENICEKYSIQRYKSELKEVYKKVYYSK